jgi:hypothetical protein
MRNWTVAGIVGDGDPIDVEGLNPWDFEWRRIEVDPIELPHPQYPSQLHRMWIYEIEGKGRTVQFAAGELYACVWGFYVPATPTHTVQ